MRCAELFRLLSFLFLRRHVLHGPRGACTRRRWVRKGADVVDPRKWEVGCPFTSFFFFFVRCEAFCGESEVWVHRRGGSCSGCVKCAPLFWLLLSPTFCADSDITEEGVLALAAAGCGRKLTSLTLQSESFGGAPCLCCSCCCGRCFSGSAGWNWCR